MALPIIPAAIAGAALVTAIIRPSTAIRLVEDGAISAAKRVARSASNAARAVRVEYSARMIDRAKQQIERENEALRTMSTDEIVALAEQQAAILARAEELRQQRVDPTYYERRKKATAKVKRRGLA